MSKLLKGKLVEAPLQEVHAVVTSVYTTGPTRLALGTYVGSNHRPGEPARFRSAAIQFGQPDVWTLRDLWLRVGLSGRDSRDLEYLGLTAKDVEPLLAPTATEIQLSLPEKIHWYFLGMSSTRDFKGEIQVRNALWLIGGLQEPNAEGVKSVLEEARHVHAYANQYLTG